ncbi:WYL domain-containing protein [Ammoniphilus resinae]|uniref:DNA-binding transcriptional regulator YafY n=1 Tax=Ammoniphilus resinae TaxID=861532 RepID=A0ABS4GVF7_9BACL|nr:WYL domain-containing protein [Ammoniphilus resinae]MBP1934245.1 putative DNA-binding transcriptional regulator YafY [Ammoniphilus resinae]
MMYDLHRYLNTEQLVEIIYQDRLGQITQRKLKLISIEGNRLKAYCLSRRAVRSFSIPNILAVFPAALTRGA